MSDYRDEEDQVMDGWIAVTPCRSYLFHKDNSAFDASWNAMVKARAEGLPSSAVSAVFRYAYAGQRHRRRRR